MLKNLSQLEVIVDGIVCRFICDIGANTAHIKEALFQFQKYVGAVEDAAKAKMEQEQALETPEETCQMNCQESNVS